MKPLNKETVPKTERTERIVQFGEGNFLRAFVDWIVQRMNQDTDFDGSVVVVQPRAGGKVAQLQAQDCLYHVNLQGLSNGRPVDSLELIDCISRTIDPYTNHEAYEALAKQPDLRFVVSNTTEAGIVFDPDCRFTDIPAASYPGKLTQLLYRRYSEFKGDEEKGLIILPCELIFNNGQRLSECIHQYIDHWQDEMDDAKGFRSWFDKACHVCTTLVDRIVPGFPKQQIESIWQRLGYADNQVVQGEVYHLWVIETPEGLDSDQLVREFPVSKAGVNVILTNDETPYHERKVTLLNGPHTLLSPVAFLSGIDIVRDACKDPIVGEYVRQVIFDELMPTLSLPEDELRQFANDVLERFMNPFVDHRVTSIMLNSFPKYQTRDLPALKTYLERKGELPRGLVKGLAAIITYYRGGNRADGTPIEPNDDPRILALLTELWKTGDTRKVAIGVLAAKDLIWKKYGNLNLIPGLTDMVTEYLDEFCNRGEK